MDIAAIANSNDNANTITTPEGKVYSNNNNIPKETAIFALFLSTLYDGKPTTPFNLSVSDLLTPLRKLLYKINYPVQDNIVDVSTLLASAKGTSHHSSLEAALDWYGGYTQEVRSELQFGDVTLSGKFDIVTPDGELKDLKHVSNFALKLLLEEKERMVGGLSIEEMSQEYPTYWKYQMQMSLYAMLNPGLVTKPYGTIIFMLNNGGDFGKYAVDSEIRFPLFPKEQLEQFVNNKIAAMKQHLADNSMPLCTDVDRGKRPASYRLTRYSASTGKYRTVNGSKFDNESDFKNFVSTKGRSGDIEERTPPSFVLCGYCNYSTLCDQQ